MILTSSAATECFSIFIINVLPLVKLEKLIDINLPYKNIIIIFPMKQYSYHTDNPSVLQGTKLRLQHSGKSQVSSKKLAFLKFNLKFNLPICNKTESNISPKISSPKILFGL